MEGMGLKFTPGRGSYYTIQVCLGLWLALLGLIASANSPNGWFNPPPASRLRLPASGFPPAPPTPYNVPLVMLEWFCKSCSKTSSVS